MAWYYFNCADLNQNPGQKSISFHTESGNQILLRGNVKNEDTDMIRLFTNMDTLVQLTKRLPISMEIQDWDLITVLGAGLAHVRFVRETQTSYSYSSLDTRVEELSRQLKQKNEQLDQELDDAIQASLDEIDQEIESDKKLERVIFTAAQQ